MGRNKYPEQTVEKIIITAARLFSEKGYEQTSIQDILDALKLSKGGLYHHFKSKEEILEAAEILIKYEGYIGRERIIADKLARLESIKIKGKFDYDSLQSLSTEARQKLKKIDPETIAQASRIPGVSPSDINVLLVLSGR